MRPRRQRLLALLLLLPQFLVLGLGGIVMCEAPDGHAAIELAGSGCCDDAHASGDAERVATAADACGPCEDSLLTVPQDRREETGPSVAAPALRRSAFDVAARPRDAGAVRAASEPRSGPHRALLRTTVLRL
jgi:hypothetical protein